MKRWNRRFGSPFRIGIILFISVALVICLRYFVAEYRRHLREARDAVARGRLSQLQLGIENYRTFYGHSLSRTSIDQRGTTTSWRVAVAPFFDDEMVRTMQSHPDRQVDIQSGNREQVAPEMLRLPFDASDAHFTSIVAVYDDAARESDISEWAIIAMVNSGIRWNEPKDLSISEFQKLLNSPLALDQPIAVLTASGKLGSIVDGSMFRFYLGSPREPLLRSFLLEGSR